MKGIERRDLAIDSLYVDSANVRTSGGAPLVELEDSIERHGILEPLIVRPGKRGKFGVVVGSRRYAAAKAAGLKKVPCIVKKFSDNEALAVSVTENIHRGNLAPEEEAGAVARLYRIHGSMGKVAKAINKSKSWVQNQLETGEFLAKVRKRRGNAVQPVVRLPEDTRKIGTIGAAAKSLFPGKPEKQVELFDALKDRPREEVNRAIRFVREKAEEAKERPVAEVVKKAFQVPHVDVRVQFDAKVSREIIRVAEKRGISWEDVVRIAVEQWIHREAGT